MIESSAKYEDPEWQEVAWAFGDKYSRPVQWRADMDAIDSKWDAKSAADPVLAALNYLVHTAKDSIIERGFHIEETSLKEACSTLEGVLGVKAEFVPWSRRVELP